MFVYPLLSIWSLFVQILSLLEEAASTKLYEHKKEAALKTIEKKDNKLREIETVRSRREVQFPNTP